MIFANLRCNKYLKKSRSIAFLYQNRIVQFSGIDRYRQQERRVVNNNIPIFVPIPSFTGYDWLSTFSTKIYEKIAKKFL